MYQDDNLPIINTIVDLQTRGFYYDFCFINDSIYCTQEKQFLREDEFSILEIYRFPCDDILMQETIIYGILVKKSLMKGILLNSFRGPAVAIPSIIIKKVQRFWTSIPM